MSTGKSIDKSVDLGLKCEQSMGYSGKNQLFIHKLSPLCG